MDQKRIIWLASYPKSGNTWLRIFLANHFSGYDHPVDINEMVQQGMHIQDTWLAAWGDPPPEHMQPKYRFKALSRIAPIWAERCGHDGLVFVKTHYIRADWNGREMIPLDLTAGGIYVVRNPLDVATSSARHYSDTNGQAVRWMNDRQRRLDHKGIIQFVGSWSQHVKSWKGAHFIRYEDMWDDPVKTFGSVLEFLQQPTDRLELAIEFSCLEELKRQEAKEGFKEDLKGTGFFGGTKKPLTENQRQKILHDHGEVMEEYGYV